MCGKITILKVTVVRVPKFCSESYVFFVFSSGIIRKIVLDICLSDHI